MLPIIFAAKFLQLLPDKQPHFLQQDPLQNDFAAVLLLPVTFPKMHDFLFDFCIPYVLLCEYL